MESLRNHAHPPSPPCRTRTIRLRATQSRRFHRSAPEIQASPSKQPSPSPLRLAPAVLLRPRVPHPSNLRVRVLTFSVSQPSKGNPNTEEISIDLVKYLCYSDECKSNSIRIIRPHFSRCGRPQTSSLKTHRQSQNRTAFFSPTSALLPHSLAFFA